MEKLKIGEIIQNLRRKNKITQEQLANHIGISTAAVSKWESGTSYPDIVSLPILARYFNVSIDELMNYRLDMNNDDIENLVSECESLMKDGKLDESIKKCEEAIEKYQYNYTLKIKLVEVYNMYTILINDVDKINKVNERIVEILEDIVENSNDINMR